MPYIIETTTPEMADHVSPGQPWPRTTTRVAVATLDEARDTAFSRMADVPRYALTDAARISESIHALPGEGGTVGPLPDGTVIEVRRVPLRDLLDTIGVSFIAAPDSTESACRAYNAR